MFVSNIHELRPQKISRTHKILFSNYELTFRKNENK